MSFQKIGAPPDIVSAKPSSTNNSFSPGKRASKFRPRTPEPRRNETISPSIQYHWSVTPGLPTPQKECMTNKTTDEDQFGRLGCSLQSHNAESSHITFFELLPDSMVAGDNALMPGNVTYIRSWLFSCIKRSIMLLVPARSDADEYAQVAEFVYSGGKHKKNSGILGKMRFCFKKLWRPFNRRK